MKNKLLFFILLFFFILNNNFISHHALAQEVCSAPSPEDIDLAIEQIKINKNIAHNLPKCLESDRHFIAKLIDLDYNYFAYVGYDIRDDENFIKYFVTAHPAIIQHISPRLKKDKSFFINIYNFAPNLLKYADASLTDNKIFMLLMVEKNANNYLYASERLQNDFDLTLQAVKSNGEMIKYASSAMQKNKAIALTAINSYTPAINFIDPALQRDPKMKKFFHKADYNFLGNFNFYLKDNYAGTPVGPKGGRGYRIVNRGKFFGNKAIINRSNNAKWDEIYRNGIETKEYKLDIREMNFGWKNDLKKYPDLIKQIEKIFFDNQVDQSTIDVLNLINLWEVSATPKILAFDLYLAREVEGEYLKPNTVNIVSLSAVAKKAKGKWIITIIDSVFDINILPNTDFKNGFKKYKIWDLYKISKKDKTPKILFAIEDEDAEYFELFVEQPSGVFAPLFQGEGYNNFNL